MKFFSNLLFFSIISLFIISLSCSSDSDILPNDDDSDTTSVDMDSTNMSDDSDDNDSTDMGDGGNGQTNNSILFNEILSPLGELDQRLIFEYNESNQLISIVFIDEFNSSFDTTNIIFSYNDNGLLNDATGNFEGNFAGEIFNSAIVEYNEDNNLELLGFSYGRNGSFRGERYEFFYTDNQISLIRFYLGRQTLPDPEVAIETAPIEDEIRFTYEGNNVSEVVTVDIEDNNLTDIEVLTFDANTNPFQNNIPFLIAQLAAITDPLFPFSEEIVFLSENNVVFRESTEDGSGEINYEFNDDGLPVSITSSFNGLDSLRISYLNE